MVAYQWKTKPYAHQVAGVRFAFEQFKKGHGAAYLFDPRTGKTKTTIDVITILYKKYGVRKVVIIAPNRVLGVWVKEFAIHCPLVVRTIIWDSDARKHPIPSQAGCYDLEVVIVNYEAFGTPGRKTPSGRRSKTTGRFKHRAMLKTWLGDSDALCVVDEAHKLKNPSGKAANMIVSMRPMFKYRLVLTGTPITKAKRAHDVYMIWQFINPDRFREWGATLDQFKNHIGRWISSNGYPQWVGPRPRGIADLKRGLHQDGMVVRRDECFDLPSSDERVILVPLKASTRFYDEMAEEMITKLDNGEIAEASIPLVVTLRLLQITSGFVGVRTPHPTKPDKFLTVAHRVGTEKLDALRELLVEEIIERDEKVVIVARFKMDLDSIEKLCEELGIKSWSIRGGLHRSVTDDNVRAFAQHDGAGAMIVQPQAAALGIDLSTAPQMIWLSLTSSWVDFQQTCDRIALSRKSTTFTYLLAEGTVDELVKDALKLDGQVSKEILTHPQRLRRY